MLIGTSTLVSVNKPLVEVRLDALLPAYSRYPYTPVAWAASQLTRTVQVPAPDDGGQA